MDLGKYRKGFFAWLFLARVFPRADFGNLEESVVLEEGNAEIGLSGSRVAETKYARRQLCQFGIAFALLDLPHRDRGIALIVETHPVPEHALLGNLVKFLGGMIFGNARYLRCRNSAASEKNC